MDIKLDQFRAQIGNQNFGEVVVGENGGLKTVNNGWFARNISCVFGTKTTAAQQRAATLSLLDAVREGLAGNGRAGASKETLMAIADRLGIQLNQKGEALDGFMAKPLDRRTIKEVVGQVDRFNMNMVNDLKFNVEKEVVKEANAALKKLDKAGVDDLPDEKFDDPQEAADFLREFQEDIARHMGTEKRHTLLALAKDVGLIRKYKPSGKKTAAETAQEIYENFRSEFVRNHTNSVIRFGEFGKNIWKDKILMQVFTKAFELAMSGRCSKFGQYGVYCHVPVETMQRLVNRHIEEVTSEAFYQDGLWHISDMDAAKKFAEICVEKMTDEEVKTVAKRDLE